MSNQIFRGAPVAAETLNKLPPIKTEYEIVSGMPVPPRKHAAYPWDAMANGDSFVAVTVDDNGRQVQRNVYVSGRAYCKKYRPTARIVTRLEDKGVRVWLVDKQA